MRGIWIEFKQQLVQNVIAPILLRGDSGCDVIERMTLDVLNVGAVTVADQLQSYAVGLERKIRHDFLHI